jgi:hypothetical protein
MSSRGSSCPNQKRPAPGAIRWDGPHQVDEEEVGGSLGDAGVESRESDTEATRRDVPLEVGGLSVSRLHAAASRRS